MIKIAINQTNPAGDVITLLEDLFIKWNNKILIVPAGFQCDGASVPQFLWSTISPAIDPRTLQAAIAHDYLYRNTPENWTRKEADELFYDLCRKNGLSWWASQKAYWGIRLFGAVHWKTENAK